MANSRLPEHQQRLETAAAGVLIDYLLRGFHLPALPATRINSAEWVRSHKNLVEVVYERTDWLSSAELGQLIGSGSSPAYKALVAAGMEALRAPENLSIKFSVVDDSDASGRILLRMHATYAALAQKYQRSREAVESALGTLSAHSDDDEELPELPEIHHVILDSGDLYEDLRDF